MQSSSNNIPNDKGTSATPSDPSSDESNAAAHAQILRHMEDNLADIRGGIDELIDVLHLKDKVAKVAQTGEERDVTLMLDECMRRWLTKEMGELERLRIPYNPHVNWEMIVGIDRFTDIHNWARHGGKSTPLRLYLNACRPKWEERLRRASSGYSDLEGVDMADEPVDYEPALPLQLEFSCVSSAVRMVIDLLQNYGADAIPYARYVLLYQFSVWSPIVYAVLLDGVPTITTIASTPDIKGRVELMEWISSVYYPSVTCFSPYHDVPMPPGVVVVDAPESVHQVVLLSWYGSMGSDDEGRPIAVQKPAFNMDVLDWVSERMKSNTLMRKVFDNEDWGLGAIIKAMYDGPGKIEPGHNDGGDSEADPREDPRYKALVRLMTSLPYGFKHYSTPATNIGIPIHITGLLLERLFDLLYDKVCERRSELGTKDGDDGDHAVLQGSDEWNVVRELVAAYCNHAGRMDGSDTLIITMMHHHVACKRLMTKEERFALYKELVGEAVLVPDDVTIEEIASRCTPTGEWTNGDDEGGDKGSVAENTYARTKGTNVDSEDTDDGGREDMVVVSSLSMILGIDETSLKGVPIWVDGAK